MLSENFEKRFSDLSSVDCNSTVSHLLHLLLVEFHQLNIRVSLNGLLLVVDDLVVTVDTVDVLKETF